MARVQWRRFAFFEKETLSEDAAVDLGGLPTCMAAGGARLFFGDDRGQITVANREFQGRKQYQAYRGIVLAMEFAPGLPVVPSAGTIYAGIGGNAAAAGGFLVTLGDDSDAPDPNGDAFLMLKFFLAQNLGTCIRSIQAMVPKAGGGTTISRLTALAVASDATQVAYGFSDGTVIVYQGNLASDQSTVKPPLVITPAPPPPLIPSSSVSSMRASVTAAAPVPAPAAVAALYLSERPAAAPGALPRTKLLVAYEEEEKGGDDSGGGGGGVASAATAAAAAAGDFQGILSYDTRSGAEPLVLDERGCPLNRTAFNRRTNELVVGRADGVYFYTPEDRGGAAGFEGDKQRVGCLDGYILVASMDRRSGRTAINMYDLHNKFVAFHLLLPAGQAVDRVVCMDAVGSNGTGGRPRIGGGGGGFGGGDAAAGPDRNCSVAYVLTTSNALLRLKEKDMASKLELLYRKKLYPMAISLAYASDYDVSIIMEIYRMYGDHLYAKGDFTGAMQQFCHTVGHLESSYVIRRFLDAQRIPHLTLYLEKLHDTGQATADHTTLLLNCYTKLKSVDKLDRFIGPDTAGGDAPPSSARSPRFETETAIKALKTAGYDDHAARLAARHGAHEWYFRVQLERARPEVGKALEYLGSLEFADAERLLKKYGKALVNHMPQETTGIVMALCTGRYTATAPSPDAGAAGASSSGPTANGTAAASANGLPSSAAMEAAVGAAGMGRAAAPQDVPRSQAEEFMPLFLDQPRWLRVFLECVVREDGRASATVANTLLDLLLREWAALSEEERDRGSDAPAVPEPGLSGSSSSSATAATSATAAGTGTGTVTIGSVTVGAQRLQRESAVMALLESPRADYDTDHALVLVQALGFRPGQLYLYERLGLTDLVLERFVETGDVRNMVRMCRKEGRQKAELWVKVLSYLVAKADAAATTAAATGMAGGAAVGAVGPPSSSGERPPGGGGGGGAESSDDEDGGASGLWGDVEDMLTMIDREQVLAPLQVLNILAQSTAVPLWVLRSHVSRHLAAAAAEADAAAAAAAELQDSTAQMRGEIQALRVSEAAAVAPGVPPAVAMELPMSVLLQGGGRAGRRGSLGGGGSGGDADDGGGGGNGGGFETVAGPGAFRAGEQHKLQEIKRLQAERAFNHEHFYKDVEEAADGFAQIAEYFGSGVVE